jgi:hypothetical protein
LKRNLTGMLLSILALPCLCDIPINSTDTYVIPQMGLASFVIYPSANGVRFILRDNTPQLSFRAATTPVAFTLEFDEDDFHNGMLNLDFTSVNVTFDCLDEIRFRINVMDAVSTNFFATKHMDVEYSNAILPSSLDYPSFVSGFCVGAIFAMYLHCDPHWHPRVLVVDLPSIANVTFTDTGFTVYPIISHPSSFPSEHDMDFVFQFVAQTELLMAPGAGISTRVSGGGVFYGSRLRVQATDEFLRIKTADQSISFFCDLISVPWDRSTFPGGLFNFIDSRYVPRPDQPILYSGEMRYCVYDTAICEVPGSFPLNITGATFAIPASGNAVTYVLCTSGTPTFRYDRNSTKSVTFIGDAQMSVLFDITLASPSGNVSFTNLADVSLTSSGDCAFECDTFELSGVGQISSTGRLLVRAAKLVNCSYGFYLRQDAVQLSISAGGSLALYDCGLAERELDGGLGDRRWQCAAQWKLAWRAAADVHKCNVVHNKCGTGEPCCARGHYLQHDQDVQPFPGNCRSCEGHGGARERDNIAAAGCRRRHPKCVAALE